MSKNIKFYIKISVICFLSTLLINSFTSKNIQTLFLGINMVISGECYHIKSILWRTIGLDNPVCSLVRHYDLIMLKALSGEPTSLLVITTAVATVITIPYKVNETLDYITVKIHDNIRSLL